MTKQEQIEIKRNKPFEVGDYVKVTIPYTETVTKTVKVGRKNEVVTSEVESRVEAKGDITAINDNVATVEFNNIKTPTSKSFEQIAISGYNQKTFRRWLTLPIDYIEHTFNECGADPFAPEKMRVQFNNKDISAFLGEAGFDYNSEDYNVRDHRSYRSINFNPCVIDAEGNKRFYQRGLVWTLEQKQLLIDSIYNWIEIGKVLIRRNSWERFEKEREETGEGHGRDCVDGKQRLCTIIEFVQNKFPDSKGNYWNDLSPKAQRRFLNYDMISSGELSEKATDQDVIDSFLTLNFTGVQMSREHIDYVRSFRMQ
jgi:hypothetical protein